MTAARGDAPSGATALQLLTTAERLFGQYGIAGVSLRQISTAAGSANSSAVHYHYGTKDRLVEAIFAHRLPQLVERRTLLRARLAPDDLRGHVEAHLLPVFELAEASDNAYVSFVEQFQRSPGAHRILAEQADIHRSFQTFLAGVREVLPDVPRRVLSLRTAQVQSMSITAAADRERAIAFKDAAEDFNDVPPFGLFVSSLVDGFTGYLAAPVAAETTRLLTARDRPQAKDGRRT